MSILQEYEQIKKDLGNGINKGMELYLELNSTLLLSDLYYKEKEFKKFDKWFKNYLLPFKIMKFDDKYSLTLDQSNFDKNIFTSRASDGITGTGYDYESLFRTFITGKLPHLSREFYYDSEAGMFCAYSDNKKSIEELAFELSKERKTNNFKEYVSQMETYDYYL